PQVIQRRLPDGSVEILGTIGVQKSGISINFGGKEYKMRSLQDWNDMFGDIGTQQRAWYLVKQFKRFLYEVAPEQVDSIVGVFEKHQSLLDSVTTWNKREKAELLRVLQQDAINGPATIRSQDIPLDLLERRNALRKLNKTLDKAEDIYSPIKAGIREEVLNGTIWKNIDARIDAFRDAAREFNIATLVAEADILDKMVVEAVQFVPENSDELLRELSFISDLSQGIGERISEVRSITRARARKLKGNEADMFHQKSAELLGDFLGKSRDSVEQILDNIKNAARNVSVQPQEITWEGLGDEAKGLVLKAINQLPTSLRRMVRIVRTGKVPSGVLAQYDHLTRTITFPPRGRINADSIYHEIYHAATGGRVDTGDYRLISKWIEQFSGFSKDVTGDITARIERAKTAAASNPGLKDMPPSVQLLNDRSWLVGDRLEPWYVFYDEQQAHMFELYVGGILDHVEPKYFKMFGIEKTPERVAAIKKFFQDNFGVPDKALNLKPDQLTRLDAFTDAIRLRHANAMATRDLDRQIIKDAMSKTPRGKRDDSFWDMLEAKRSAEAWEPYWAMEEELLDKVEDLKLQMMNSLGVDITEPAWIPPQMQEPIAPAHVAYLMGTTGDNLNQALTKAGAMATIRPKRGFVSWVYSRAKKAAAKVNKTAEEIGFSKEAIGDVYDQMFANLGLDPKAVANEPLTPAMMQLEDIRKELHNLNATKKISEADFVKFQTYLTSVADDLDKLPHYQSPEWIKAKDSAMMKARGQFEMDFPDYDHRNMADAAMRTIYPFWTYEWQRYPWLLREAFKHPVTGTAVNRYRDNTDQGYVAIPGTDIQFNPLRGTVFMGGFRRLMMRDFPEYYDAFPGMKIVDSISRMGFYPGAHIMLPIIAFGATSGKPEWGEVAPGWVKTPLDMAAQLFPKEAGYVREHFFPDRFRDYLTMLTLGEWGYDADELWRKKKTKIALTADEQKLWDNAAASATGLKGALFEQFGIFRLRPPEYTQMLKDQQELIAKMTGVPVEVQERINQFYPATGKRFSDYYKLDPLQQKIVYSNEQYKRWRGVTTSLYPSSWQDLDVRIQNYYDAIEKLSEEYRHTGVFDEQGNKTSDSIDELTTQMIAGQISPSQWTDARASLLDKISTAQSEIGKRDYPDVPKTLDEREKVLRDRGQVVPTRSWPEELMRLYYDIKPEKRFNIDSGRDEYDFDAYYANIDALLESLPNEFSQRLLERIQFDWNPMEKLYWQVSRDYFRSYNAVRSLVLQEYTDEQRHTIRRFEVARGQERATLQSAIGPDGQKLISGFQSKVALARKRMRYIDQTTDAWLYFFGKTDTVQTEQAKQQYESLVKQYMRPEMAGRR
ncbi:MAG: hypothetical protein PHQ43_07390, partial [Dehalococcoidales bacterium]|nr:hypothetical protein [Dehalococcoidales bacterium]